MTFAVVSAVSSLDQIFCCCFENKDIFIVLFVLFYVHREANRLNDLFLLFLYDIFLHVFFTFYSRVGIHLYFRYILVISEYFWACGKNG